MCVWDGGGGSNCSSIYTQIKNIPNANRMKISCIFSLISQEKNVQRNGYIIDRYGKYMLSCIVKKNMKFFVKHCNYELIAHCLLDPFFMQFIECLRTLLLNDKFSKNLIFFVTAWLFLSFRIS